MEAAGFNPYNSFNSTLVQLKEILILDKGIGIVCFNSTLVQLKVENHDFSMLPKRVSILP